MKIGTKEWKEHRKKLNSNWIKNNKERYNASKYLYREKLKIKILAKYSDNKICCAYCGEEDVDVLCIDHINNNGTKHREELNVSQKGGGAGTRVYEALNKLDFQLGLQVLCFNCNTKKEMERKKTLRKQNKFYAERMKEITEYLNKMKGGDIC